jgi:hypothetical protein
MDKIDQASARQALFSFGLDEGSLPICHLVEDLDQMVKPSTESAMSELTNDGPCKTLLPRRSGESRFGPLQYYYPASRTGVVPSRNSA